MKTLRRTSLALALIPLLGAVLLDAERQASGGRDQPPKVEVKLVGKIDVDTPGPLGLTVVGDYAYATVWDHGLRVVDVSNPAAPKKTGACRLSGSAKDVSVAGGYVYVAAQEGGLRVVDVSDPEAPIEVASYTPAVEARPGAEGQWGPVVEAVVVSGKYAYVAFNYVPQGKDAWRGVLQVLDVSDPTSPTELTSVERSGLFLDVELAGEYAYVVEKGHTLYVMNVSDPSAPTEVGACVELAEPQGVAVAGDYAYVADDDGAMYVVDISSPESPRHVGTYEDQGDRPGIAESVAVMGDYAFVCDAVSRLLCVVDVSDPTAPREVASFAVPGTAGGVAVAGDYVYVNVWRGGLYVLKLTDDQGR